MSLRRRTLEAAFAQRPPAPDNPFGASVSALDALMRELVPAQYDRIVIYDWTVAHVLVHLTATDGLLAHSLGLQAPPPVPGEDLLARTQRMIAEAPPAAEVRRAWFDQAMAIARVPLGDEVLQVGPIRLPGKDHATGRAFETWIHSRDIAAAVGLPRHSPPPKHLHAMANLAMRLLSSLVTQARFVLTGPAGGVWDLGRPTVELTMDTLDFCLLAADRLSVSALDHQVRGDEEIAGRVLAVVPSFAGP
ncbi:MAG TPA: maleylpyruvate isomerase family mycothiol-dependent enzyme [Candidatus Limnocylindrales bacterium]|nr:maleylpyruvate isomerase family mycothiol-dependent enzyme [Candidatus Limnocylindrales bacterium]